jgi:hypothetical protein
MEFVSYARLYLSITKKDGLGRSFIDMPQMNGFCFAVMMNL